ncbi:toprim domain-containing protein [Candidatus Wolfebacteria bacterium]|nr:toprim domain-containing protein [Candidatus Wolfebacteria bacterium]
MDIITKLADIFSTFPGIGKRQSKRFVYHLLLQDKKFIDNFIASVTELKKEIAVCAECQRFFVGRETEKHICTLCADSQRDTGALMLVEKDIDLENIEKSGAYKGKYFVLGGVVPILEENPEEKIRADALVKIVEKRKPKEIILALSANPEGENTALFVQKILASLQKKLDFTLSAFGRGLSTGTELEYSDADTIKNALVNRTK